MVHDKMILVLAIGSHVCFLAIWKQVEQRHFIMCHVTEHSKILEVLWLGAGLLALLILYFFALWGTKDHVRC